MFKKIKENLMFMLSENRRKRQNRIEKIIKIKNFKMVENGITFNERFRT